MRSKAVLLCIFLVIQAAQAETYRTPRAGEEFRTRILNKPVVAPARDRRDVTSLTVGVQWIPDGPGSPAILPFGGALVVRDEREAGTNSLLPFGAVFVWRNPEQGKYRFRGVFSGLYNDVRYHITRRDWRGFEGVLTFENFTVPIARPEFVEGQEIEEVELEWYYVRGGVGLGYRKSLAPGNQDNALEVTLTYEPGYLWFDRGSDTAPDFIEPQDSYEGRVHLRARADALERNLMELAHHGVSGGFDLIYGHRANWQDWGGSVFGVDDSDTHRDYVAASFYGVAAGSVPIFDSERHRWIASVYAGLGQDLDRFSAFRLSARPNAPEWEALSRPDLPGAAFDEFFSRSYAIAELRYRYEALFFLFPYVRGTWAWIDRPRFTEGSRVSNEMDSLPALGAGLTTGAPWRSLIEVDYSYNFGILRNPDGDPAFGGHTLMFSISKEF